MDGRKNNGGNSTKSNKPNDKRKNQGRELVSKYVSEDMTYQDFKGLMDKLLKMAIGGDTKAASIWLDRVAGRPDVKKEIDHKGEINIPLSKWADDSKES